MKNRSSILFKKQESQIDSTTSIIYFRLIALWILCEAMLGSIIFTLHIPISGLLIGSCAIVLISLIAFYGPGRGAILKATIIVAIFKMMLTPQAPPTAYLAVFFQGFLGEILFWNKKYFRVATALLAVLALIESALQRIITLTIIYGIDIWTAFNKFVSKLTGEGEVTNYSYFIIFCYVLLHIVVGFLIGIWAGSLPSKIKNINSGFKNYVFDYSDMHTTTILEIKKNKRFKIIFLIIWAILLLLYVQSFFEIGKSILPQNQILKILIRSVIIVLTWYFLISPVLKRILNTWLQKKKRQSAEQIRQIVSLLPSIQNMVVKSWSISSEKKGLGRMRLFSKIVLANTFNVSPYKQ